MQPFPLLFDLCTSIHDGKVHASRGEDKQTMLHITRWSFPQHKDHLNFYCFWSSHHQETSFFLTMGHWETVVLWNAVDNNWRLLICDLTRSCDKVPGTIQEESGLCGGCVNLWRWVYWLWLVMIYKRQGGRCFHQANEAKKNVMCRGSVSIKVCFSSIMTAVPPLLFLFHFSFSSQNFGEPLNWKSECFVLKEVPTLDLVLRYSGFVFLKLHIHDWK